MKFFLKLKALTSIDDLSDKITEFIAFNKALLSKIFIIFIVFIILIFTISLFNNQNLDKSFNELFKIEFNYAKFQKETDEDKKGELKNETIKLIQSLKPSFKGYPYQRSNIIEAKIYEEDGDLDKALLNYLEAFKVKNHLEVLIKFKIALLKEDKGDLDGALSDFTEIANKLNLNKKMTFTEKERLYFSIARIYENKDNLKKAKEYYIYIQDNFENNPWRNLAKSKLLSLNE